ncbi:MAG: recombinase family protein [Silicimonas sp.]|nr:recombinase family protein [Silicimonas sp.]
MTRIRCAIYTRKSSEEGLEQEFNSLHAQREACAAYVLSQKAEGWVLLDEPYDDGGLSGGTMERPALGRLLADIDAGRIDQIVVYKIDRLTRSLSDFAKIVDILDAAGASFVSVTQSFNTATSMGRLTLNMLLSFAQFEREVTAERIRDKIAASKKKGLWMGGNVPLGYDADGRSLKINEAEAKTVRALYVLYRQHPAIRRVKEEADGLGLVTKRRVAPDGTPSGGQQFTRGHIWQVLTNPIYAGRIRHKGQVYEGQHDAIILATDWDALQKRMQEGAARVRKGRPRGSGKVQRSGLAGKIFDETGNRLTPSHSKSRIGARLRYYVSHRLIAKSGEGGTDGWRLPAPELESTVADLIQRHLTMPGVVLTLIPDCLASDVAQLQDRLQKVLAAGTPDRILEFPARVDLAPGRMAISLDRVELARVLAVPNDRINLELLAIHAPFRLRKRGVETKIILNGKTRPVDEVLLTNMAYAHAWFALIKGGQTTSEISKATGTSKRRVQQILDLAFLAPDIVRDVLNGNQPLGFTSDWCLRHTLPSDWDAQRKLFATL